MLRRSLFALCGVFLLAGAAPEGGGPDPGLKVLEQLFRAPQAEAAWFTPAFIEKVPIEQVRALLSNIRQEMGAFQSVTGSGHDFTVHLAKGDLSARLVLTGDGRIAGLLLKPAATQGSLDDHVKRIAALPGEIAVLVTRNGEDLAALHADDPLAVGSAFKLAVLKAVVEAVDRKKLAWDQVVRLDASWRSLPSGSLQNWALGTPVTIATLADMMISVSDNTAADALAALVGRTALERISPRNTPFLTTREAFILKGAANRALRARWLSAGVEARRALLGEIDASPLPAAEGISSEASLGVEWRFTARELAALLQDLHDVPALAINPGLASRADWRDIRYKGGSEMDCINMSTLVLGRDGVRHAVVVSWNGKGASLEALMTPYTGLLQSLARGDDGRAGGQVVARKS